MPVAQVGDLFLQLKDRRGVIEALDQEQIARRKDNQHEPVKVDGNSVDHEVCDTEVIEPETSAAKSEKHSANDLDDLADDQGPKSGPNICEFALSKLVQGQCVLPLEISAERLPG